MDKYQIFFYNFHRTRLYHYESQIFKQNNY